MQRQNYSEFGTPGGHLAIIVSVGIYAFGLIGQKILAADHPIYLVAFWQFAGAAIILWAITLIIDGRVGLTLRSALVPFLWGVMAPGLSLIANMLGSRMTDGVTMTMVWGLLPFVAPLVSPYLIGERLRVDVLMGALVALVGVGLGTWSRYAEGWTSIEGVLLSGLAVLLAGLGFVLGRFLNRDGDIWRRSAALQISGAAVTGLVFSVLLLGSGVAQPPLSGSSDALIMVYLIGGMTVANFLLFNYALAKVPVAFVSIHTALNPVFGALAAWALLGDRIRPADGLMIALVVAGVALPNLVQLLRRRKRR
jgi:drug/metabolite transporter (DMT)-like permease